ncbi:MAG: IS3 family transposase, partial [Bacteroidota bacterium]
THSRACFLVNCSRGKKYYKKRMPIKDKPIKEAIEKVMGSSRKGRKKIIKLVQKELPEVGCSKIRRIYERNGFALMQKQKKRKWNNPKNKATVPMYGNIEWAIDFMHDSLANGRTIRTLNIIDPYNRECKGIFIAHSIPSVRVIEFLEQAIEKYGQPKYIRSDNGPEFTSKQFQLWMHYKKIDWQKIEKGKPQQNCFIERFNRTMREEFLDANLFFSVEHVNEMAEYYREEYNYLRPHESLGQLTPIEYVA